MTTNEELRERVQIITDLYREKFKMDNATTDETWKTLMKNSLEKALINWKISCYENDWVYPFDFKIYK